MTKRSMLLAFVALGTFGTSQDAAAQGTPDESPDCPLVGDTHCTGLDVSVDFDFSSGTLFAQASATDDSGDPVWYTFMAHGWPGDIVLGPQRESAAAIEVRSGEWTVTVIADDDPACDDEAADARRSVKVYVPHIDFAMSGRGDVDGNRVLDIADPIRLLVHLFMAPMRVTCRAALDANADGTVDISDGIYILRFLFLGGPGLEPPSPRCGFTGLESDYRLGCDSGGSC